MEEVEVNDEERGFLDNDIIEHGREQHITQDTYGFRPSFFTALFIVVVFGTLTCSLFGVSSPATTTRWTSSTFKTPLNSVYVSTPATISSSTPLSNQFTLAVKERLAKRVSSSRVRFLFVAGIEGSGHHAVREIHLRCEQLHGPCAHSDRITKLLYHGENNADGIFVYGNDHQTVSSISEMREELKSAVKVEMNKYKKPTLVLLNTGFGAGVGMISYPNYNGAGKSIHHPDLNELAKTFEEAGADLRIFVLQARLECCWMLFST